MGKKKPKLTATTLKVTTGVAQLKATAVAAGAVTESVAVAESVAPNPRALLEYEPPPLPAQPEAAVLESAGLIGGGVDLLGFRVAEADPALPPVPISYDRDRRTWLLLSDYSYTYEGHNLTAKAGYAFDLASVPRPLWWLIAPNELSIIAPLFHDLLYEYKGTLPNECVSPYRTYTRHEADDLFLHLMEVEGVDWWRRNAAYSAVRAAGGIYWVT
jgi:hypothetical protein